MFICPINWLHRWGSCLFKSKINRIQYVHLKETIKLPVSFEINPIFTIFNKQQWNEKHHQIKKNYQISSFENTNTR